MPKSAEIPHLAYYICDNEVRLKHIQAMCKDSKLTQTFQENRRNLLERLILLCTKGWQHHVENLAKELLLS